MRYILALCILVAAVPVSAATLSWTDNATNEMGFEVERQAAACTAPDAFAKVGDVGANVKTFVDPGPLTEGQSYCWRIRAWNTVDGTPTGARQFSAYSNKAGMTVPFALPAAPSQLGVTP
jgi:hypothetical protein